MLNHLWQSTLVAALAGLLTVALRKNRARLRYWIWLAASLKFLVPFSSLVAIGERVEWHRTGTPPAVTRMLDRATRVWTPATAPPRTLPPAVPFTGRDWSEALPLIWLCGSLAVVARWIILWRQASRADRVREPGVYGLVRPVVRMPAGISDRLTVPQLNAVLAHELCHAHYRDNLTAAIHSAVEVLFWFHPFVWWIGARLIHERERACDEEVLRKGHDPETYAEGILRVCRFYLEQPVPFIAGVTGSNLKWRMETILENRRATQLTQAKRALLVGAAVATIAIPVVIGIANAPPLLAQPPKRSFIAATIKPANPNENGLAVGRPSPDTFRAINQTLQNLVTEAYFGDAADLGLVSGGPHWVRSARFDIQAKADGVIRESAFPGMLQALLIERFQLKVREQQKQIPVYALVLANRNGRLGPKIHAVSAEEAAYCDAREANGADADPERGKDGFHRCSGSGRGGIRLRGSRLSGLTSFLSELLGRPLIDKTGLRGRYDVDLEVELYWDHIVDGSPVDVTKNSALFDAMQTQLGLKLESTRGPVRTIVIDSAERPSPN